MAWSAFTIPDMGLPMFRTRPGGTDGDGMASYRARDACHAHGEWERYRNSLINPARELFSAKGNNGMIYVTSDLHGYPLRDFLRLLEKAKFSDADDLIVLGDVIDRNGDGGVAMLRWMLQQVNVRMILGNHEAMLLSCRFLFDAVTDENLAQFDQEKMDLLSVWMMNGAEPTLKALRGLFREDGETAREILQYLEEAPLYEIVNVRGRRYLLVHAGLGSFSKDRPLSEYTPDELLWTRPDINQQYFQNTMTVLGHTPTAYYGARYAGRMIKTPTWMDIDTGAASGKPPMLLRLDDEQPFYMPAL